MSLSNDTWYEHRVWCSTEGVYVNQITKTQTPLTVCPNNSEHTLDVTSNCIISQKSSSTVNVAQENAGSTTNGKYTAHSRTFTALACPTGAESTGLLTSDVFRMEIPFTVFTGIFQARPGMDRDRIDLRLVPKLSQVLGIVMAPISYGDTTVAVYSPALALAGVESATVLFTNALTGFESEPVDVASVDVANGLIHLKHPVELEGGQQIPSGATSTVTLLSNIIGTVTTGHPVTTMNRWVYITAPEQAWNEILESRWINIFRTSANKSQRCMIDKIDRVNRRVHIGESFNVSMDPADGPIYVQLTLKPLNNCVLKDNSEFILGGSMIGGAYHPRGITIIADYTRKQNTPIEVDYMFEMFA